MSYPSLSLFLFSLSFFVLISHSPKLSVGPHWPMLIGAHILLVVLSWLIFYERAFNKFSWYSVVTVFCFFSSIILLLKTALSDAGFLPRKFDIEMSTPSQDTKTYYCDECNADRSQDVFHCYDCDVCVQQWVFSSSSPPFFLKKLVLMYLFTVDMIIIACGFLNVLEKAISKFFINS